MKWLLVLPVLFALGAAWLAVRPQKVLVPRVQGLSVGEARLRVSEAGLRPKLVSEPPDDQGAPRAGVVAQVPPPGRRVGEDEEVRLFFEEGSGNARAEAAPADEAPVAPPPGESTPLAFVRANEVFVRYPGEPEQRIAGTVGDVLSDPVWDPGTGEVAYTHRRSRSGNAEILAVDARAPDGERRVTEGDGSYTSPAFAPDGSRLAVVDENGDRLCLVTPPDRFPRCRDDARWHYARPAWGDPGTLYALRRRSASGEGWDEVVRMHARERGTLTPERTPVARGDLLSVAVARDGRLAVVARTPGQEAYHVELLSPEGERLAVQSSADRSCEVVWGGDALFVSRNACDPEQRSGEIVRIDPARLDAGGTKLLDGEDPAVAG